LYHEILDDAMEFAIFVALRHAFFAIFARAATAA
jgi:hypothetical protein